MAFADSADRHTHVAMPGLDNVMLWACVKRARANEIVSELVSLGLLVKHRGGHRGRRAEYIVFPAGCCSDCTPHEKASITAAPLRGSEATAAAPIDATRLESEIASAALAPTVEKGAGKGLVASSPLPNFLNNPPNPQAAPRGASCAKHPRAPHPNCRGCGTTARQIRETAIVAARVAKRDRELERVRLRTAAEAAAAADSQTPAVQELLQRARAAITGGAA
jgi:hypothetical protein